MEQVHHVAIEAEARLTLARCLLGGRRRSILHVRAMAELLLDVDGEIEVVGEIEGAIFDESIDHGA